MLYSYVRPGSRLWPDHPMERTIKIKLQFIYIILIKLIICYFHYIKPLMRLLSGARKLRNSTQYNHTHNFVIIVYIFGNLMVEELWLFPGHYDAAGPLHWQATHNCRYTFKFNCMITLVRGFLVQLIVSCNRLRRRHPIKSLPRDKGQRRDSGAQSIRIWITSSLFLYDSRNYTQIINLLVCHSGLYNNYYGFVGAICSSDCCYCSRPKVGNS